MKKGIIGLGLFALAASVFMTSTSSTEAAGFKHLLDWVKPSIYYWPEVGSTDPDAHSCILCKFQSKGKSASMKVGGTRLKDKNVGHLENAYGVGNVMSPQGVEEDDTSFVTGRGWVSSKHAVSMGGFVDPDATSASPSPAASLNGVTPAPQANTYCGWCHNPGDGHGGREFKNVTDDPTKAKTLKKNLSGVACVACHPSNNFKKQHPQSSRYANYMPGSDPDDFDNAWKAVARDPDGVYDGKGSNKQCLFCHGSYHEFARASHTNLVKSGDLRCFDCHMAVFNTLPSGLEERYHNMKVQANGPVSCMGQCHIHDFSKKELAAKIAALMGGHTQKKNDLPKF